MSMNMPNHPPPIRIGARDFARLEQLLDLPAWRTHPGRDALQAELARAEVLEPAQMPADVVTMDSEVICRDEASGAEHRLRLCYPHQVGEGASAGRVSVLAPVGSALLGLALGDRIDWNGPNGRALPLRVVRIVHQPEADGDRPA
jgi:regulator of nucleoside diphosphate kinase